MKFVLTLLAAISLSGLLSPFIRPSSSEKLFERGIELWEQEQYEQAAEAFAEAREIRTTAASTFDVGTALVGARRHEEGERFLRSLAADEELAASSWYNSGNSQLAQGALDDAIESYTQALRVEPSNMSAKRNLEIALQRRQEQERQQQGGEEGEEESPEDEESASRNRQQSEQLDPDLEQVLRSIDQQEREELSRMRRADAVRRPTDW